MRTIRQHGPGPALLTGPETTFAPLEETPTLSLAQISSILRARRKVVLILVVSLLALAAFFPGILNEALPIATVLSRLDSPALSLTIELVILGAFVKTGVGLIHGLNERLARAWAEHGRPMPRMARSLVALGIMAVAVFVASSIGIIALIGRGYRFSSYFFLVIFFVPLMTRGWWLAVRERRRTPLRERLDIHRERNESR